MSSFKNIYHGLKEAANKKITESEALDKQSKKYKSELFVKSIDNETGNLIKEFQKTTKTFVKIGFEINGKKAECQEVPLLTSENSDVIENFAKTICLTLGKVVNQINGYDGYNVSNTCLIKGWPLNLNTSDEEIKDDPLVMGIADAISNGKNLDLPISIGVDDEDREELDEETIGRMTVTVKKEQI